MTNTEYIEMLQEENAEIKQEVTTALEHCAEYGIEPKTDDRIIRFTDNGLRYFTDVNWSKMTAKELDRLCGDVENELNALQEYLNGLQALQANLAKLEELNA